MLTVSLPFSHSEPLLLLTSIANYGLLEDGRFRFIFILFVFASSTESTQFTSPLFSLSTVVILHATPSICLYEAETGGRGSLTTPCWDQAACSSP